MPSATKVNASVRIRFYAAAATERGGHGDVICPPCDEGCKPEHIGLMIEVFEGRGGEHQPLTASPGVGSKGDWRMREP